MHSRATKATPKGTPAPAPSTASRLGWRFPPCPAVCLVLSSILRSGMECRIGLSWSVALPPPLSAENPSQLPSLPKPAVAGSRSRWARPISALPAVPMGQKKVPPTKQITLRPPPQPYRSLGSTRKFRKASELDHEAPGEAFLSACFCSIRLQALGSVETTRAAPPVHVTPAPWHTGSRTAPLS